jgi:hypothetical protein
MYLPFELSPNSWVHGSWFSSLGAGDGIKRDLQPQFALEYDALSGFRLRVLKERLLERI